MKTRIALIAMVVGLGFASAGLWAAGDQDREGAATEGPITVTMLQRQDPTTLGDYKSKVFYQMILEKFDIDLEVNAVANEPFKERLRVTILSNDLPDIIGHPNVGIAEINEWGKSGLLYPINDLLEHLPELEKRLEVYPWDADYVTADDGNIYAYPGGYPEPFFTNGQFVRKDLLESVGFDLSTVETFEDHLDMYRALKQANDGRPPLSQRKDHMGRLLGGALQPMGLNPRGRTYDDADDEFFYSLRHPDVIEGIKWLRTMFEEELLHPDSLSMSEDEWEPLAGLAMWPALWDNVSWSYGPARRVNTQDPSRNVEFAVVVPPKWNGKQVPFRMGRTLGPTAVLSAETEYAAEISRMMNFFYSKEGSDQAWYGEPDKDFVYVPQVYKGKEIQVPIPLFRTPRYQYEFPAGFELPAPLRDEEAYREWADGYGYIELFGTLRSPVYRKYEMNAVAAEDNPILYDYVAKMKDIYTAPPEPNFSYGDYGEEILSLQNALDTASHEIAARIIVGQLPVSAWDELQAKLVQIGVDRYERLVNQAYQEYKSGRN